VNPTEDIERVKKALLTITSNQNFQEEREGETIILKLESNDREILTNFHSMLRQEKILDSARKILFSGAVTNKIVFHLNKQVAFAGHISFCQPRSESPLGSINIEIKCQNPEEFIDWLAPSTTRTQ
jgi:hypothetical protein